MIKSNSSSKSYIGESNEKIFYEGYIDTEDIIEIKGDRCLFRGRLSGEINIGGNIVSPEKIEKLILENKEVRMARLFAKKSSILGNILFCEVVLDDKVEDKKNYCEYIKKNCKEKMNFFEVPSVISYVSTIKLNKSGKISRKK